MFFGLYRLDIQSIVKEPYVTQNSFLCFVLLHIITMKPKSFNCQMRLKKEMQNHGKAI